MPNNIEEQLRKFAKQPYWHSDHLPVPFPDTLGLLQAGMLELATLGADAPYRLWRDLDDDERRWIKARREHFTWHVRLSQAGHDAVTNTPPRRTAEMTEPESALELYDWAVEQFADQLGDKPTDRKVYDCLKQHGAALHNLGTWSRNLRRRRKLAGRQKQTNRTPYFGHSAARPRDA